MNNLTIINFVISIFFYGMIISFLFAFPKVLPVKTKRQLFINVFVHGGLALFIWCIISLLLFFPNDLGVSNFIPKEYFWDFLLMQIPIFFLFYLWHLNKKI